MTSHTPSGSKACGICHRRKVKCDLANGVSPCTNCRKADYTCRPHVRKRARYDDAEDEIPGSAHPSERLQSGGQDTSASPFQDEAVKSRIYLGRSEYIGGDIPFTEDEGVEDQDNSRPAIQSPLPSKDFFVSRSARASLTDAFMERCYPWMPIVERSWLEKTSEQDEEPLLNYATFLAGSRVSSAAALSQQSPYFYQQARKMFFAGAERNPMLALVSSCLLQWWSPTGPEQVSLDTSGFWASTGAFLSYQVGLHIDPEASPDSGFRRRLWWTLRSRDSLISVAVGRPRITNQEDSNVKIISLRDFNAADVNAHLFCAYAPICSLLGDIAETHRRHKLNGLAKADFEERLLSWAKTVPNQFRLFEYDKQKSLAKYNFEAWQLWIPYLISIIVLERNAESTSSHTTACLLASSTIASIFEDFTTRDEVKYLGPVWAFYALAAGLCQLTGYRYSSLRPVAQQDIATLRSSLEQLAVRWGSARRALRSLAKVQASVEHMAPFQGLPDPLTNRLRTLFDPFGPSLCPSWPLLWQEEISPTGKVASNAGQSDPRDMDAALLLSSLPSGNSIRPADLTLPSTSAYDMDLERGSVADEPFPGVDTTFQPPGSWLFDDFDFGLPGFDT